MRQVRNISAKAEIAANQNIKEKKYWLTQLSGISGKSHFSYDYDNNLQDKGRESGSIPFDTVEFGFYDHLFSGLMKLRNGSDPRLHMILLAGLVILLNRYTGSQDIIIGTPVYKQAIEGEFINTVLAFRNRITDSQTFKELLTQVRQTMIEADENQDYPIEILAEQLDLPFSDNNGFPLFDIALLLENIQDRRYLRHIHLNMIFSFLRADTCIRGVLEYNPYLYNRTTVQRIANYFQHLLQNALEDVDLPAAHIDILPPKEKKRLLHDFNDTQQDYPKDKTIQELFEQQAAKTPGNIAVSWVEPGISPITYNQLNQKANQLARVLRKIGVTTESVVGIMMERSMDMIISLVAILKAGGAYLPIDPNPPEERILYMLEDSGAKIIMPGNEAKKKIPFTTLQGFEDNYAARVEVTAPRAHIKGFDQLPMPDRSLINLKNYQNKIGMASVTNCISLQTTRGCPFECLYCHKIWSKNHVFRSAENIYSEIDYYYKKGVRNFASIDDCFNLNRENSSRLFRMIIKNKLKLQLFFPNGLRGDIMTPDYIDLMAEAGTRGINLSLETGSPRLQKLLKKNLNLEKFKQVVDYIASQHPEIMLEMASMHGFPGESEEEAMMTLNFIKSIKWIHFPYIHILKIFPNTEMEEFALKQGVSKEAIMQSKDLAFHELPETLPFPKSFTRKYQAEFMNEYFLNKERLRKVIPVQMTILSEMALAQKYNAYLPVEINCLQDILEFAQLEDMELPRENLRKIENTPDIFANERGTGKTGSAPGVTQAGKILFLDLSQHFSSHSMLYKVVEQPLGLIYLLTYLNQRFGDKIDGRIYKSGNDFDDFGQLKVLIDQYKPQLIAIRTLTFFKDFFHETAAHIRQWGVDVPIITGGPYAASDYDTILKDININLVVIGEGEETLGELVEKMLENDFKLPPPDELRKIKGIAFANNFAAKDKSRKIILLDQLYDILPGENPANPEPVATGNNLAYVMYTSGSTGRSKGVMVEHRQVNNCIRWMQDKFNLSEKDITLQRTNLTFDPSVWEIFWPLYLGASIRIIDSYQGKDANFLIRLMSENEKPELTMMYCPATLVNAMTYLLETRPVKPKLKLPWLIIGAEPISMETVKKFYSYFEGKIVNTYGPTECTINNTYYDLDPDDERAIVPIGKPIANNQIYILSKDLMPMPIKIVGEICIAGSSVARGYIHNREITARNFIDNPFGQGKLYKTGDLGRWLEDGNIEIIGRIDYQIKIRGYRIEPGEIETALKSHEDINDCIVVTHEKGTKKSRQKTGECKRCGIWSNYPGIVINNDGICNVCQNLDQYKKLIQQYFGTMDDLEFKIRERNRTKKGKYDCLLVYACERVATYALYKLVDMGFNVLTATYDSGHYDQASLDRIKAITTKIGVDHVFLKHQRSNDILKESLKIAQTMCKGCIHTSSALAADYALKNNIKFVIGETLSRGQIVENKLYHFMELGISDVKELEREIAKLQKNTPLIDKKIFDIIDIKEVTDGSIYDKVEFIDFYRYCDVTNQEMINFLDNMDPYWKNLDTSAIYSTDCKICQVGNFNHLAEKGYHYTGSAKSWDKRLGLTTLQDIKEDLEIGVSKEEYTEFLNNLGYRKEIVPEKNDKHLYAYYVLEKAALNKKLPVSQLREYLSKRLPEYMIPSYFVHMNELPLTPNGKINRNDLPIPETKVEGDYIAPRDTLEENLAEIWAEVLEIDKNLISIDGNFFDLGGQSLKSTIMVSKIHKELNVKMSLAEMFQLPTIREMAQHIKIEGHLLNTVQKEFEVNTNIQDISQFPTISGLYDLNRKSEKSNYREIEKHPEREYYDLSYAQKRLWLLYQLNPDDPAFNLPARITLYDSVDEIGVRKTFEKLVERHESFRTYFKTIKGEVVQIIRSQSQVNLETFDLAHLEGQAREERRDQLFKEESIKPFNLEIPPLFRMKLIKYSHDEFDVILNMHHIITDGWSLEVLEREFTLLYESYKTGRNSYLPLLKNRYIDYVYWQESLLADKEKIQGAREFWEKQLKGDHPILDLPYDFPKKNIEKESAAYGIVIPEEIMLNLKRIATEHKGSLFMVLLAAFNLLLYRITGQEDLLLGVPGAARQHEDLKNIVGFFVNTLILRDKINPDESFIHFLIRVQRNTLRVLEYQSFPLELLFSEFKIRYPEISVFFNMLIFGNTTQKNLNHDPSYHLQTVQNAKFDIACYLSEYKNGITIETHYPKELFKPITIEKIMRLYRVILEDIASNPEKKVGECQYSLTRQKKKLTFSSPVRVLRD
jgi:amino acid adenylation domain-containing protein